METRKVQMTGGSSLMITLPKEWTETAGIKKNDQLNLYPQADGSLIVTPSSEQRKEHTTKKIDSDEIKDTDLLFRILVGAYMSGYTTIEVTSSHRITGRIRDTVEKMTQTAIGVEIIEEYDDRMILKDLVDPSEMRMNRTTERMRSLVSNMLSDVMDSMRNMEITSLDDVISRDNDVDRLEWLVTRQANMAHQDTSICRKMELDQNEMMMYYTVCRIIERIGDHVITIAKNAKILMERGIDKKVMDEILSIGISVNEVFNASVKAWADEDIIHANDAIRASEGIVERCRNINRHAMKEVFDSAMAATMIAGSLRRISEYSMDISEHAINTAV